MRSTLSGSKPEEVLHNPKLNKFTAFTMKERDALGIRGFLPPVVETMEQQVERELNLLRGKGEPLEKYIHLMSLLARNERLFFSLVVNNVEEMTPYVYTPTVGEACVQFSNLYVQPAGLYLSLQDKGKVRDILKHWAKSHKQTRAIVVTDGERILGLGDQGANGMGIPVGKLQLYVAMGGIHPDETLPITLDVGTNNQSLLGDARYIGLKSARLRGKDYDDFIDEFVHAVVKTFGVECLIQWEDFGNSTAFGILEKYRHTVLSFNDDIQGTASVTLASLVASLRLSKGTRNGAAKLRDHVYLFLGAGEAGVGIAELIADSVARVEDIPKTEARERIWLVDSKGLVCKDRAKDEVLQHHKQPFCHSLTEEMKAVLKGDFQSLDLLCKAVNATALIGVSAQPRTFTEAVCRQMGENCERPAIFALSNPTSKAECTAEEAIQWTEGRALFCSGSPFPETSYEGRRIKTGQSNNAYIFPGLALGVNAVQIKTIPDELLEVAARSLAEQVSEEDLALGSLVPPLGRIRELSVKIAAKVAERGHELGLARMKKLPKDLEAHCREMMYTPEY